jgi:hypothetical protein
MDQALDAIPQRAHSRRMAKAAAEPEAERRWKKYKAPHLVKT